MTIPGQGPRLILSRRRSQVPYQIDMSSITRLTPIPKPPKDYDFLNRPIVDPMQVVKGLGLSQPLEDQLRQSVEQWMKAPTPIAFMKSAYEGLRAFAPNNSSIRNEMLRRCRQLWRDTSNWRPEPSRYHINLIKSWEPMEGVQGLRRPVSGGYEYLFPPVSDSEPPPGLIHQFQLKQAAEPGLELVWCCEEWGLEDHVEHRAEFLEKSATHKYLKRIPTGKPKPRYRYFYRHPKTKELVSSEDLHEGAKFKVSHRGKHGHFEIEKHDQKKGIVHVRHDESGKKAYIREEDFHQMIQAYHAKKGKPKPLKLQREEQQQRLPKTGKKDIKPKKKKEPKEKISARHITGKDLPAVMKEGYDQVEGFGKNKDDLIRLAKSRKDREHAVVEQKDGSFVLVSRTKGQKGERPGQGKKTQVFMRGEGGKGIQKMDAEYVLMEAQDITASHNPITFSQHDDYPEGVQERRYHEVPEEQAKIERISKELEPAIVANTNPDAINGTPIVTEDGIVLGGNGRTMGLQRAYFQHDQNAAKLKQYLKTHAKTFGLHSDDVEKMKQPILVRRVKAGKDAEKLRRLGRRMNEALTQGMDPRSEEVSLGKNYVNADTVSTLVSGVGEDQTINDFLSSHASGPFVASLFRSGIIDEFNRAKFINNDTGLLNEDGRSRVERVLAARFIPDASILDQMKPSLRANIAKATGALLTAEENGWDVRDSLMTAVKADLDMQKRKFKTGIDEIKTYLRQEEMGFKGADLSTQIKKDPIARALLEIVREHNGPKKLPAGFRRFAYRAKQAEHDKGALPGFGGAEKITPAEALGMEFKLSTAEPKQTELAASLQTEFDLYKARKNPPDSKLLNRVLWFIQDQIKGEIDGSTMDGGPAKIHGSIIATKALDFAKECIQFDPEMAKEIGRSKINRNTVNGLIEAVARSYSAKLIKSRLAALTLIKAEQLGLFGPGGPKPAEKKPEKSTPTKPKLVISAKPKPPGAGWQVIPGGKKGGYRRRKGKSWEYWYPEKGLVKEIHPEDKPDIPKKLMDALRFMGTGIHSPAVGGKISRFDKRVGHLLGDLLGRGLVKRLDVNGNRAYQVTEKGAALIGATENPEPETAKEELDRIDFKQLGREAFAAGLRAGWANNPKVKKIFDAYHSKKPELFNKYIKDYIAGWQEAQEGPSFGEVEKDLTKKDGFALGKMAYHAGIKGSVFDDPVTRKLMRESKNKPEEKIKFATDYASGQKAAEAEESKPILKPTEQKGSTRRFESAGEYVAGARRDLYNMTTEDLEKDPLLAAKLVTRSNVIGNWKPDWADADRENEVTAACSFAKREIINRVARKPFNHSAIRDAYRKGCTRLLDGLARCKTVEDINEFLDEWKDLTTGESVGTPVDVAKVPFNFNPKSLSGFTYGIDLIKWINQGNTPSMSDIAKGLNDLQSSPALKSDLLHAAGLKGIRHFPDGKTAPLYPADKHLNSEYKLFTGALGKRFALLVGHTVKTSQGRGPLIGWSGWDSEQERKKLNAMMDQVQKSDDPWSWVVAEKEKKSKKTKEKIEEISREDSKWVWTRETFPVERKGGPPVKIPDDSIEFIKNFNLPTVDYGNWANDAEREFHVRGANEGLHDLADVLGIPANKIGINKRLAIAFGARGTGGKRAPVAHYEPARKIINITKLNGAGSLCHEWGHFLDHAITLAAYPMQDKPMHASVNLSSQKIPESIRVAMAGVMSAIKYRDETPEQAKERKELGQRLKKELYSRGLHLKAARALIKYDRIVERDESGKATAFVRTIVEDENYKNYKRSAEKYNELVSQYNKTLGGRETAHYSIAKTLSGGKYYREDHELFARAFESYIEDKLNSQNRKSTYLVAGTRLGIPEHAGIFMPPDSEERKRVNAAMDRLIIELKNNDQFSKSLMNVLSADDLQKAEQLGLFGPSKPAGEKTKKLVVPTKTKPTPPGAGWQIIPGGKRGGYRRRKGHGWEYWYPEKGVTQTPHHEDKPEPEAKPEPKSSREFWEGLKVGDWFQVPQYDSLKRRPKGENYVYQVLKDEGHGVYQVRYKGARKPIKVTLGDNGQMVRATFSVGERVSWGYAHESEKPEPYVKPEKKQVAQAELGAGEHPFFKEVKEEYDELIKIYSKKGIKGPKAEKMKNALYDVLVQVSKLPPDADVGNEHSFGSDSPRANFRRAIVHINDYLRSKASAAHASKRKEIKEKRAEAERAEVKADQSLDELPRGETPDVVKNNPDAAQLYEHLKNRRIVDEYTIPDYPISRFGDRGKLQVKVNYKPGHGWRIETRTTNRSGAWNKWKTSTYHSRPVYVVEPQGDEQGVLLHFSGYDTLKGAILTKVRGQPVMSFEDGEAAKELLKLAKQRRVAAEIKPSEAQEAALKQRNEEARQQQIERLKTQYKRIIGEAQYRIDQVLGVADPDRLGSIKRRGYETSRRLLSEWGYDPDTGKRRQGRGKLDKIERALKKFGEELPGESPGVGDVKKTGAARMAELERMQQAKPAPKLTEYQRRLGQFNTPHPVAYQMAELADVKGKTVLDPTAGEGRLLKYALEQGAVSALGFEIDPKLKEFANRGDQTVRQANFLQVDPSISRADVLLMNPPFTTKGVEHVTETAKIIEKAINQHWTGKGKAALILPAGPSGDKLIAPFKHLVTHEQSLDDKSFKKEGTQVNSKLYILEKE